MSAPTSYDEVDYPSLLFRQSRPDRLAVIARLHSVAPPPVDTARMLQIGGGDGLDAIALAAAYPRAHFLNFDLAAQPIERGRRWSEAAGLANAQHEVLDILDAAEKLDGDYDYIVAHGVYAWVPDVVRDATMALIARKLSPHGVAFISYNALPGGYSRMALRDMMFHHVAHLTDPAARIAAAQAMMRSFAVPQENDPPITAAMRSEAKVALTYADGLLYHDQLNGFYAPQSLTAVTQAARGHGLSYLGDARGGGLDQGFLDPGKADMDEDTWLHALQARDYRIGRYFRASLFVRAEAQVSRVVHHHAARDMWATTRAEHKGDNLFAVGPTSIRITDDRRATVLHRLIAARPDWLPVADLVDDDDALAPLCHQAIEGFIDLHTTPPPFAITPPDRPVASALARMQIADGDRMVATLDHNLVAIDDPAERALIGKLDGNVAAATLPPALLKRIAARTLLVR